jgi:hypothetical protein
MYVKYKKQNSLSNSSDLSDNEVNDYDNNSDDISEDVKSKKIRRHNYTLEEILVINSKYDNKQF